VVSFHFPTADGESDLIASCVREGVEWIAAVEAACSRFDPDSEVVGLWRRPGRWMAASPILAGALDMALRLAALTDGAFDPAIGAQLARRERSVHQYTGAPLRISGAPDASFRDIELDVERSRVRLQRPLLLDLGAIAKGLAVDLAARALAAVAPCIINAGGDAYLLGRPDDARPWRIGVSGSANRLLGTYKSTGDEAICTSGPWFRPTVDGGHHLLDARTRRSGNTARSATVLAPSATVADGAATAAFILGPTEGLALLHELALDGLVQANDGAISSTSGWLERSDQPIKSTTASQDALVQEKRT
jgi:thiamine biosynthesis lipoprotein